MFEQFEQKADEKDNFFNRFLNLAANNQVVTLIIIGLLVFGAIAFLGQTQPTKRGVVLDAPAKKIHDPDAAIIGEKPFQSSWDNEVLCVKRYLRDTLNDYDSSEFLEWSEVGKIQVEGEKYWGVRLKLRAKNAFGGYIVKNTSYLIRHDKVVLALGLNADDY
jgi:hypothetical protein